MFNERKLAVLIDSDNVSAKYAQFILQEVAKYGIPTYKRVYGDWENNINGWRDAALNYSILPVQQSCYITGKNATDFAMIIDAMDILYTGNVDGFVLVTSDSDFTRLAIKLRESGKLVVGMGALKTPRAFTISCNHFCYLNQVSEPEFDEKAIRQAVIEYVCEKGSERLDLAKISDMLTSRFGNINFSELGYKRFSSFIDSFEELRRNNTFVSMRKAKQSAPASVDKLEKITESNISAAISEYLEQNKDYHDNMMKIESYLCTRFGKIDYSQFGSKRFAKFIDKQPHLKREGTNVSPVIVQQSVSPSITADIFAKETFDYAEANMPKGGNIGQLNNSMIGKYGKSYYKEIGFASFREALDSVMTVKVDSNLLFVKLDEQDKPVAVDVIPIDVNDIASAVKLYAKNNMPDGGNIGQLNNLLINSYGKDYCAALGFADFKSMLASIEGVNVKKNHIFINKPTQKQQKQTEQFVTSAEEIGVENIEHIIFEASEIEPKQVVEVLSVAEDDTSITEHKKDEIIVAETEQKQSTDESQHNEQSYEKPNINAIRREVLHFAAISENGGSISALGKIIADKYGKGFLKELGFSSMRKLAADVNGVKIKNNKLFIDEDFARQTEEIEDFVKNFAKSEGSRSIRALGIKLKKQFEGFDFHVYGYEKFTDFINAIDGVKAERYHVIPVE